MKVIVLDGYTLNPGDLNWSELEALGDLTIYDRTPSDLVIERAKGAEIIFTNKTPLPDLVLQQLPDLTYIGVLATGYNIVDVEAANRLNIVVTNVPGYGTSSVVQHTFSLILEHTNHVQHHSDASRNGQWSKSEDFCFWNYPIVELAGKTIGIIGFGDIGKKVADVAMAFGMNVIASSRTKTNQSSRSNFRWVELDDLFQQADIVTLHCPLTSETKGLINEERLKKMKPTSFLVNTSRGPLVVEDDLAKALNQGWIAGAGIDVLSIEPPSVDNPLLTAKNCFITPHISWASLEARTRLMDQAIENLKSFLGENPINRVGL